MDEVGGHRLEELEGREGGVDKQGATGGVEMTDDAVPRGESPMRQCAAVTITVRVVPSGRVTVPGAPWVHTPGGWLVASGTRIGAPGPTVAAWAAGVAASRAAARRRGYITPH